jgi:DNA methyltransferase 1-associated protein 1
MLTHWIKAHVIPPAYPFAKFNVRSQVTTYSEEEYEKAIALVQDPLMTDWTKEQTDLLFKLCTRFDLRWIIIGDRFQTLCKNSNKSLEDIKYRYYESIRLLQEYREKNSKLTAATTNTPVIVDPVIKEEKTVAVLKEESSTSTTEGRETEAIIPSTPDETPVASTTKTTTATSPPRPTTTPISTVSDPNDKYKFNIEYEKQRKKQLDVSIGTKYNTSYHSTHYLIYTHIQVAFSRTTEEENEIKRLTEELKTVEQQLKKVAVKVDIKKKKELSDVPYKIVRKIPTGVFLRSHMLLLPEANPPMIDPNTGASTVASVKSSTNQKAAPTLSIKTIKKMELMLEELGVPRRPMPTRPVCEIFDSLRQETVALLSLRKHLVSKQNEMQVLKDRYQSLTGTKYKPVTTPIIKPHMESGAAKNDSNGNTLKGTDPSTSGAASGTAIAAAGITIGSQGKALKHSEKSFRQSNKRKGTGSTPGLSSKKNKKVA